MTETAFPALQKILDWAAFVGKSEVFTVVEQARKDLEAARALLAKADQFANGKGTFNSALRELRAAIAACLPPSPRFSG
jgi:hypothetical protein